LLGAINLGAVGVRDNQAYGRGDRTGSECPVRRQRSQR